MMGPMKIPPGSALTQRHRFGTVWANRAGFFQSETQHPGVQVATAQGWDGDGAGTRTEPKLLPWEGEEAETINTFALVVENPGVFTKRGEAPSPPWGPQGPARPAQLGTHLGAEWGQWPSRAQDSAELQARSFPQAPPSGQVQARRAGGWHAALLGGFKSGSPPCRTGLGLWKWPSSLQRKEVRAEGEVKNIGTAPTPPEGRQQVYHPSSLSARCS